MWIVLYTQPKIGKILHCVWLIASKELINFTSSFICPPVTVHISKKTAVNILDESHKLFYKECTLSIHAGFVRIIICKCGYFKRVRGYCSSWSRWFHVEREARWLAYWAHLKYDILCLYLKGQIINEDFTRWIRK